jgi:hypothetical protein
MGWKNVKEHYRIGHIVQVTEKGICIGSPYIHDLLVIGLDGAIVKPYTTKGVNEDLERYQKEMDHDMGKLRELVVNHDTFEKSIPVYTYDKGDILEKQCEEPKWPNVTHDGLLMYDNAFSTDKAKVVKWAKENAKLWLETCGARLEEKRAEVLKWERMLADAESDRRKLETDYPTSKSN